MQTTCLRHDARVGGVDAIHVGVDQAFVCLHGGRHGHGRGVGATTAQRGDVAFAIDALKTRDDDDLAGGQVSAHALVVDGFDACLGVAAVGTNRHLPACVADCLHAFCLQSNGQQCRGGLLAGGGQHIQLAVVSLHGALGRQFLGQAEQAVGFAAHGAGNHHHLVAGARPFGHALGNVANALGRAHRGAAVFVNDQCHWILGG